MIEESKNYSKVMKNRFNKEFVMTKKDNKDFKNSTKCLICDNTYVDNDVKVRDHCHRGFAHRNCNISIKLNHEISIAFHNLKNMDSHFIRQEMSYQMNWKNIRALTSIAIYKKYCE